MATAIPPVKFIDTDASGSCVCLNGPGSALLGILATPEPVVQLPLYCRAVVLSFWNLISDIPLMLAKYLYLFVKNGDGRTLG